jgi:hypothetical protein
VTNRIGWHGPFPRFGWGKCLPCGGKRLLFYFNDQYLVGRDQGRRAVSEPRCGPCIDTWLAARRERLQDMPQDHV